MEKTCDYEICTGCGACIEVCPKDCISFREEKKGHLFPKIDTSVCIDCKKCVRVCPALKTIDSHRPSAAYAAMAKDRHDYLTTTSGGAAQILSKHIINNGGVVYGCAAMSGANIRHIRVDNISDLDHLKGSKYVQSNLLEILPTIKEDVRSGKKVLFIGVPCQVASIISLLGGRPDNLYLVDLICHGVPSLESLHQYLKRHVGNLSIIEDLKFRSIKGFQMIVFGSRVHNEEREILYKSNPIAQSPYGDDYYSPFFYGFSYRPSCYRCQFAKPSRVSDITIGDFWGLNNEKLPSHFPSHEKGISVVLPISTKGAYLVSLIRTNMYMAERPVEEAVKGNKQLQHPTRKSLRIKIYDMLLPVIGNKASFRLANIDMPLRIILRPYLKKIKNFF